MIPIKTPLHIALERDQSDYKDSKTIEEIVGFLCDIGCPINSVDTEKKTPLHYAVIRQLHGSVNILLKYGADPTIRDITGRNCLHYSFMGKIVKNPILEEEDDDEDEDQKKTKIIRDIVKIDSKYLDKYSEQVINILYKITSPPTYNSEDFYIFNGDTTNLLKKLSLFIENNVTGSINKYLQTKIGDITLSQPFYNNPEIKPIFDQVIFSKKIDPINLLGGTPPKSLSPEITDITLELTFKDYLKIFGKYLNDGKEIDLTKIKNTDIGKGRNTQIWQEIRSNIPGLNIDNKYSFNVVNIPFAKMIGNNMNKKLYNKYHFLQIYHYFVLGWFWKNISEGKIGGYKVEQLYKDISKISVIASNLYKFMKKNIL